jgi:hypothetical protein
MTNDEWRMTNEWMNQWMNQWINEWINESMNQSMNQSISEWMNEWINQSINQSMKSEEWKVKITSLWGHFSSKTSKLYAIANLIIVNETLNTINNRNVREQSKEEIETGRVWWRQIKQNEREEFRLWDPLFCSV